MLASPVVSPCCGYIPGTDSDPVSLPRFTALFGLSGSQRAANSHPQILGVFLSVEILLVKGLLLISGNQQQQLVCRGIFISLHVSFAWQKWKGILVILLKPLPPLVEFEIAELSQFAQCKSIGIWHLRWVCCTSTQMQVMYICDLLSNPLSVPSVDENRCVVTEYCMFRQPSVSGDYLILVTAGVCQKVM